MFISSTAVAGDYKDHLGLFSGSDLAESSKEFQQKNQQEYENRRQQMEQDK